MIHEQISMIHEQISMIHEYEQGLALSAPIVADITRVHSDSDNVLDEHSAVDVEDPDRTCDWLVLVVLVVHQHLLRLLHRSHCPRVPPREILLDYDCQADVANPG